MLILQVDKKEKKDNVSSLLVIYLLVAIVLIGFILIQQGKGANAGASLVVARQELCLALPVQVTFFLVQPQF